MVVRLNGELREIPDGSTVASLLALLGVKPPRVAVLVNGAVILRARQAAQAIAAGDVVELAPLLAGA